MDDVNADIDFDNRSNLKMISVPYAVRENMYYRCEALDDPVVDINGRSVTYDNGQLER